MVALRSEYEHKVTGQRVIVRKVEPDRVRVQSQGQRPFRVAMDDFMREWAPAVTFWKPRRR